ncbi:hypothetical protein [Lysobacter capsici]|uniref:hypothetical protein n=1 Tax=Lysobacter capsici TaxID=435897 RepID=UPI00287BA13E|nr:hypothetical protein [Lysobacter capsici]WND87886.1 hypothetical protein RJ609_10230 [Lysobacter capsici]
MLARNTTVVAGHIRGSTLLNEPPNRAFSNSGDGGIALFDPWFATVIVFNLRTTPPAARRDST